MTIHDPSVVAGIDQARALLRDLTDDARRHHARGCDDPTACTGSAALARMLKNDWQVGQVLALALAERAQPVPERLDVECAVIEALDQCKAERLLSFVRSEGDDFGQGLFSARTDAVAVLAALDRIGALRSRP